MAGFFGKLFGSKAKTEIVSAPNAQDLIVEVLEKLILLSDLDLEFSIEWSSEEDEGAKNCWIDIVGQDEELLRKRDGQLLDAFQLLLTRIIQHQVTEERVYVYVDNDGYREETHKDLIELAERLKNVALNKGKPVYLRALPPKERKVVHQFLAEDGLVKSRSIGEGLYKKIKLYPLKTNDSQRELEG